MRCMANRALGLYFLVLSVTAELLFMEALLSLGLHSYSPTEHVEMSLVLLQVQGLMCLKRGSNDAQSVSDKGD